MTGYFLISTQLPPAASLNRTEAVGKQIDKILDSYPEIKTYIGVNGFSIMGGGELSNAGTYFVILKNWNDEKAKNIPPRLSITASTAKPTASRKHRYSQWYLRPFPD